MNRLLVFDVNETLLDLSPLRPHFEEAFGTAEVMQQWFAMLLHTSLVVTLADSYTDFGSLAGHALDLIASRHGLTLSQADRTKILQQIRDLPPHPEVPESLDRLKAAGFRMATLTNSPPHVLEAQMANSGLARYFEPLISIDAVRLFKPAPETYRMAAKKLGVPLEQIRMVAAHDWDVVGALQAGCSAAFIARGGRIYHPHYKKPDVIGQDLEEVARQIIEIDV